MASVTNNYGRKCYKSTDEALAGAIAQMDNIDVVGVEQSIEDTNRRHAEMAQARVNQENKHRELTARLDKQIGRVRLGKLTPDELSDLVMGRK